eukprot:9099305-Pyramimonas_sp.AAC.2
MGDTTIDDLEPTIPRNPPKKIRRPSPGNCPPSHGARRVSGCVFAAQSGPSHAKSGDRERARPLIARGEPWFVFLEPPCKAFSQILSISGHQEPSGDVLRTRVEGMITLRFAIELAQMQRRTGREFLLEQPSGASSWELDFVSKFGDLEGMFFVRIDQCRFDLSVSSEGVPMRPTGLLANRVEIARAAFGFRCEGGRKHAVLEGSSLAQVSRGPRNQATSSPVPRSV